MTIEMIMEGVHHLPGSETTPREELLFPLSSSQQRCWFIHALNPGGSVLNIALRWELKGRFDASTIEQAFQTIVDRHEILRTRFIDKDGEPMQEVAGRLDFHLSVVDLTAVPEEKRLDEAMVTAQAGLKIAPADATLLNTLVTLHNLRDRAAEPHAAPR